MLKRFRSPPVNLFSLTDVQTCALKKHIQKLESGELSLTVTNCLCGNKGGRLLARYDRYGIPIDTYVCKYCGLLRSDPYLDENSLESFYKETYRLLYSEGKKANYLFFEEQQEHGRQIAEKLISKGLLREGMTVFDVGCGAGGALLDFEKRKCKTYGCDWGEDYLEYGRDAGLCLEHGSCESLRRFGPADIVILSHVLEHFTTPQNELKKIKSLLKPNGVIYVEVPGLFAMHKTYEDFFLFLQNAHTFHFSLQTLKSIMETVGFELLYGGEQICSVWKNSENPPVSIRKNRKQYWATMTYLWVTEALRKFKLLRLANFITGLFRRLERKLFSNRKTLHINI